jgi:hypothetical protein
LYIDNHHHLHWLNDALIVELSYSRGKPHLKVSIRKVIVEVAIPKAGRRIAEVLSLLSVNSHMK